MEKLYKIVAVYAVAAFFILTASSANALVLTFDTIPGTQTIYTSVAYEGYLFTSDHFHMFGWARRPSTDFSFNGTTTISYESGRGDAIEMSRLDGSAFSLWSLDVSEFYSSSFAALSDRPNAQVLDITGYYVDGHTTSLQLSLDSIFADGPGGVVDFQHFALPELFNEVNRVVFTGLQLNNQLGGVAFDNLEVVAVPEPSSLLLMAFGSGMMFLSRRKVKKIQ